MTDNEIKEDCLQEAGIDLDRYSDTELTQIKDAMRRYSKAKLKLLGIAVVGNSTPTAFEKNNLPLETRYLYCKGIEIYQKIQSYELGIINKTDFINEVNAIEDSYK